MAAIEELKADLDPDDTQVVRLSKESQQLTEDMAHKAKVELKLVRLADSPSN